MITKISDGALRVLKTGGTFKVHSVYKNTINLWNYSDFISITAADTALTPISVVTDDTDFEKLNIKNGDDAAVNDGGISISNLRFIVSPDAEVVSTYIDGAGSCSRELLKDAAEIIYAELKSNSAEGSFFHAISDEAETHHPLVTGIDEAKQTLTEASELISGNMYYQASYKLGELIGLGIGLTPAGDDFTSGMILALLLSGSSSAARLLDKLTGMILSSLCKTGDISSQYLRCSCESRFSEPLVMLSRAIIKGSRELIAKHTNKEISIGHSSGCDTLSGFVWIVNQLN